MTAKDHIQSELENCTNYVLSVDDKKMLDQEGVESFIYRKLTSKKFRKWAVDESSEKQARNAISTSVAQNKPLQFRFPFGGYKLWRIPTSPEVDWAEFFSIAHYCSYLAPIVAVYEPGIEFLFASDDMIIERMDNIPASDTNAYFNSFKLLLENFRKYFPKNMKMDIVRIADLYQDKAQMEEELVANVEKVKIEFANSDPERRKKMLTTSELNICMDGAKDLTKLSDEEKQKIIGMGPVYHDAYCALSKRREFNRGEDKIVIFTTLIPNAIAIGTTKSSVTKFWTGMGVLRHSEDSYKDLILSPKQIEGAKFSDEAVSIDGLTGENFTEIKILD